MDKRWKGAHSAHDEELLFFFKRKNISFCFLFCEFLCEGEKTPKDKGKVRNNKVNHLRNWKNM